MPQRRCHSDTEHKQRNMGNTLSASEIVDMHKGPEGRHRRVVEAEISSARQEACRASQPDDVKPVHACLCPGKSEQPAGSIVNTCRFNIHVALRTHSSKRVNYQDPTIPVRPAACASFRAYTKQSVVRSGITGLLSQSCRQSRRESHCQSKGCDKVKGDKRGCRNARRARAAIRIQALLRGIAVRNVKREVMSIIALFCTL